MPYVKNLLQKWIGTHLTENVLSFMKPEVSLSCLPLDHILSHLSQVNTLFPLSF